MRGDHFQIDNHGIDLVGSTCSYVENYRAATAQKYTVYYGVSSNYFSKSSRGLMVLRIADHLKGVQLHNRCRALDAKLSRC